jgi:hypothetical protein
MADDNPIGSDALQRRVATARAQAGANTSFTGPPPDPFVAPWLSAPTPPPTEPPPAARSSPKEPANVNGKRGRGRPLLSRDKVNSAVEDEEGFPSKRHALAWNLAHAMLKTYGREMAANLNRADLHLAQKLMQNGTLLLRFGVPMDNLGALIRLARELSRQSADLAPDDPRIDALRKGLERDESTLLEMTADPDDEGNGLEESDDGD